MENTDRAKTVQKPCSHGLQNKKAMKSFDFTAFFGAMEGTRTPGLLIRSQSLYPAELPTHTFRSCSARNEIYFTISGDGLSTGFLKKFWGGPKKFRRRRLRRPNGGAMARPVGVAARPPWPVSRRSGGELAAPPLPMASITLVAGDGAVDAGQSHVGAGHGVHCAHYVPFHARALLHQAGTGSQTRPSRLPRAMAAAAVQAAACRLSGNRGPRRPWRWRRPPPA